MLLGLQKSENLAEKGLSAEVPYLTLEIDYLEWLTSKYLDCVSDSVQ